MTSPSPASGGAPGGPLLEARKVSKRYGGVQAVQTTDWTLCRSEVHGIVGENGAGKSTLAKMVAGVTAPDRGTILIEGVKHRFSNPADALSQGIAIVSQEVSLVPQLSVAENVFLGSETSKLGFLEDDLESRLAKLTDATGFDINANTAVYQLSAAKQKEVEILRALGRDARVIVMDEPTASLSAYEGNKLLAVTKRLKSQGVSVVFVSHFLEEVLGLCDVVTVMRNGRIVSSSPTDDETPETLMKSMLGRDDVSAVYPPKELPPADAPVALSVAKLSRHEVFDDVTFSIRSGEILALAGLVGSGRSEIAHAIFGAHPPDSGTIKIHGEVVQLNDPHAAVDVGIALIPESRKSQGLVLGRDVGENVTLASLERVSSYGVISDVAERRSAQEIVDSMDVAPRDLSAKTSALSGGNQQKVLFGKWLMREPSILVADEPTSGVDVGAKASIHQIIVDLASSGVAVLLISSELQELLGLAHRVLAIRAGEVVEEFGPEATEESITKAVFGRSATAARGETGGTP